MEFTYGLILFLLVILLLFLMGLALVKEITSGNFRNNSHMYGVALFLKNNGQLTYKNLKKRCPECTNVDYYNIKNHIKGADIAAHPIIGDRSVDTRARPVMVPEPNFTQP